MHGSAKAKKALVVLEADYTTPSNSAEAKKALVILKEADCPTLPEDNLEGTFC